MTAPHYGKRNLGLGTAASPGDTLYFFFGTYNDSGNSEADTGLSVTDIEVYKDNGTTPRLTDSGYSLILDTGTPGLRRFRIQLFNTADDASFYANGSWYQVAVDNVKIDGKLVRFWAGSFEIGEPRANVVQLGGDTGAANQLRAAFANGFNDTGINDNLSRIRFDVDTGLRAQISDVDTGLHDTLADYDTGIRGILVTTGVNVSRIDGDTGAPDQLAKAYATTPTYFQQVNLVQLRSDTGGADRWYRYTQKLDTGGDATVSASVDTGQVNNAIWNGLRADHTAAGSFGQYVTANLDLIDADTGFATQIGKFGSLLSSAGQIDTGTINGGFIPANIRQIAGDTGAAAHLAQLADEYDTGRLAAEASATLDTGAVNQAVWQANAIRGITAITDTGLSDNLGRIRSDVDTGLRAQIADADTGIHDAIADLDTGIRALLALRDTGAIATAVWAGDTGLRDHITNVDTGLTNRLNVIASDVDTGLRAQVSDVDTGVHAVLAVIQAKTDSLTFTVAGVVDSNIQRVNDVAIQGTGDTGLGDTWRPA